MRSVFLLIGVIFSIPISISAQQQWNTPNFEWQYQYYDPVDDASQAAQHSPNYDQNTIQEIGEGLNLGTQIWKEQQEQQERSLPITPTYSPTPRYPNYSYHVYVYELRQRHVTWYDYMTAIEAQRRRELQWRSEIATFPPGYTQDTTRLYNQRKLAKIAARQSLAQEAEPTTSMQNGEDESVIATQSPPVLENQATTIVVPIPVEKPQGQEPATLKVKTETSETEAIIPQGTNEQQLHTMQELLKQQTEISLIREIKSLLILCSLISIPLLLVIFWGIKYIQVSHQGGQ